MRADRRARTRWQIGLADLSLLIACVAVGAGARPGAVAGSAAGPVATPTAKPEIWPDAALFPRGEAMLRPEAQARLAAYARPAGVIIRVTYAPYNEGARLDAWELAAARSAQLARYWMARGVAADAVTILAPEPGADGRVTLSLM